MKNNEIIHKIEIPSDYGKLRSILLKRWNSPYDLGALLFLGIVLFLRRILGLRTWPKQNLWQSSGMYLCTEFVEEYLGEELDPLITPYKMFVELSNRQEGEYSE